jgi:hypothetical protein
MSGVKVVDGKKYCAKCGIEVGNENYCAKCGNPLRLVAAADKLSRDLAVLDNFIREAIDYSKTHKCSIEDALGEVRKTYEE